MEVRIVSKKCPLFFEWTHNVGSFASNCSQDANSVDEENQIDEIDKPSLFSFFPLLPSQKLRIWYIFIIEVFIRTAVPPEFCF